MAEDDFYNVEGLGKLPNEDQPVRKPYRARQKSHLRRNILIAAGVLVVLGAAGGAAWLVKHHKAKPAPKSTSSTTSTPSAPSASSSTASSTTHYVSKGQDLNLEFDYPSNWTATPASGGNTNDQVITLNSPVVSIPDASNASANGKMILTIRPGGAQLSELATNNPTAAQTSIQVAYTHPTAAQHQYPFISFIHFSNGETVPGAFEEVVITGVDQFTKGAVFSPDSLTDLDPVIAVNFYRCNTSDCSGKGTGLLSITNNTWQSNSFVQQAQAVFASLKLH
jgi:hypothetical protein